MNDALAVLPTSVGFDPFASIGLLTRDVHRSLKEWKIEAIRQELLALKHIEQKYRELERFNTVAPITAKKPTAAYFRELHHPMPNSILVPADLAKFATVDISNFATVNLSSFATSSISNFTTASGAVGITNILPSTESVYFSPDVASFNTARGWAIGVLWDYIGDIVSIGTAEYSSDPVSSHSQKLIEIAKLKAGWDGYNAEPISADAIRHAIAFVRSLGMQGSLFEPFPDPDGSVGLEGHKNNKSVYLNFSSLGAIAYVIKGGNSIHRGHDVNAETVHKLLDVLF